MISALFVMNGGPYYGLFNVDPWDAYRDARRFNGPGPVIAHPPCERWGRYWSGGPSAKKRRILGDDDGCFVSALYAVRKFGGVLEHPEASHAFRVFRLPRPNFNGGWTEADEFGGRSCCVAQGHYGHMAQKMTWLYAVGIKYPELKWGRCSGKVRLDLGYHSKEERARAPKSKAPKRLAKRQNTATPVRFRNLLIRMVSP